MATFTGFIDSGEIFIGGPVPPMEAYIAAHDYAHEGWFFRIVRASDRQWQVWVKWGRTLKPACCKHKRTFVPEEPKLLWKPRASRKLRQQIPPQFRRALEVASG